MKVVDERYNEQIRFGSLNIAEPFIYKDCYYMRVEQIEGSYNAINLETGYLGTFKDDDCVEAVKGHIVIKPLKKK